MSKEKIRELALANGFKLKQQPDGTMELNSYVYEFAAALMAEAGRAGFVAGLEYQRYNAVMQWERDDSADYYAESIRQGGDV